MGIREKRMNRLIELFSEKEIIEVDEIKKELEVSDRSIKSYISTLRELGFNIRAENKKYRVIRDKSIKGNLLGKQEFRLMNIIQLVGENSALLDRAALLSKIYDTLCDYTNISKKTLERSIKECEDRGFIYVDENQNYRLSIDTMMIHKAG